MKVVTALLVSLLLPCAVLYAQLPPMLPSNPAQTPIDGGLGLLAAAGGAYAWKKLRASKK